MRQVRTPQLQQLVHRHLQNWELRNQVSRRRQLEAEPVIGLGPYVALSRLPFSRGDEIARRVAELLGWQFFDREIVDFIARDAKTLDRFVDSLDEKVRGAMDDWIQTAIDAHSLGHLSYLRHLKRVVMTIARHGNAVILGRGAGFFLPPEAGLRVFVTAPAARRRALLARERNLPPGKATAALRRLDEQRRDFIRTHFPFVDQEIDQHDLVLNLDRLEVEAAASIVVDAFYTLDRRLDGD